MFNIEIIQYVIFYNHFIFHLVNLFMKESLTWKCHIRTFLKNWFFFHNFFFKILSVLSNVMWRISLTQDFTLLMIFLFFNNPCHLKLKSYKQLHNLTNDQESSTKKQKFPTFQTSSKPGLMYLIAVYSFFNKTMCPFFFPKMLMGGPIQNLYLVCDTTYLCIFLDIKSWYYWDTFAIVSRLPEFGNVLCVIVLWHWSNGSCQTGTDIHIIGHFSSLGFCFLNNLFFS